MTINEASKNNNKWLWLGLGGAALFCLCAVAVGGLVIMRMGQQFREGMKTDPEGASKAAHAIADYELPPGYQEQVAMDFFAYSFVMIGPGSASDGLDPASGPTIMLAQFQIATNRQQMEQQMRQAFEQRSGRGGLSMKLVEAKKMTIRGEEVEVTTYEGTDDSGFVLRQLITTFPGKDGTAMLMIMGPAQFWDKEIMDQFIESIH